MSGSRRNIETGIERKNISNCVKVTTLAHHLNLNSIPTKTKPAMLSKSGCFNIHCIDTIVYIYTYIRKTIFTIPASKGIYNYH